MIIVCWVHQNRVKLKFLIRYESEQIIGMPDVSIIEKKGEQAAERKM